MRALCSAGLDLQVVNKFGLTSVHAAARAGFKEVVQVLVEHGVEVNTRDTSLVRTPLYLAVESLRAKCVRILYAAGRTRRSRARTGRPRWPRLR